MFYLEIHTFAEMASYRVPETHTFQQTLALPPKTALIGMVGAAAGLSFRESMEFSCENQLQFGVIGTNKGRVQDLWKYRKIKSGKTISAVLLREYLIDLDLRVFVLSKNKQLIEEIRSFFLNPAYPLSAGNSDSLFKIKKVSKVSSITLKPIYEVADTVISGTHAGNYESVIDIRKLPLMRNIYAPTVHLLPTNFEFIGEERHVTERHSFTFVDTPIRLKEAVSGFEVDGRMVALL
jgi:CRISPR-associated protein Cas5t